MSSNIKVNNQIFKDVSKISVQNAVDGQPRINYIDENSIQEKSVTLKKNGTTIIKPDDGFEAMSSVNVTTNIGTEFNIHFGEESPEDTSKIWVKTNTAPNNFIISSDYPLTYTTNYANTLTPPLTNSRTYKYFNDVYYYVGNVNTDIVIYKNNTLLNLNELNSRYVNIIITIINNQLYIFAISQDYAVSIYRYDLNFNLLSTKVISSPTSYTYYNVLGACLYNDAIYIFGMRYTYRSNWGVYCIKIDLELNNYEILLDSNYYGLSSSTTYSTKGIVRDSTSNSMTVMFEVGSALISRNFEFKKEQWGTGGVISSLISSLPAITQQYMANDGLTYYQTSTGIYEVYATDGDLVYNPIITQSLTGGAISVSDTSIVYTNSSNYFWDKYIDVDNGTIIALNAGVNSTKIAQSINISISSFVYVQDNTPTLLSWYKYNSETSEWEEQ